ncbi:MAG: DUF1638 domain-containing protein [Pseudomonadota bacterium]
MAKIGVVTCQILELEFAHVLSNDPDVSDIWVVHDNFSRELAMVLENNTLKPVHPVACVDAFPQEESHGLAVLIQVLEVGLHTNIPNLTRGVTAAVKKMAYYVDAVLLGYGLCGNALNHAEELFKDVPVPVLLPMEAEHPVDDCVGLIIGGRENYYAEQCRCAGTMFMNAGFSRHWNKIMSAEIPEKLIPKKDKIMKRLMANYKRCLILPTPVLEEAGIRENIQEFNEKFNLKTDIRPGTLTLLENAWKEVKKAARGKSDR